MPNVGDGLTTLKAKVGSKLCSWNMGLLTTCRKVEAARGEAEDQYAYLDVFRQLVKKAGGPDLNDDQADQLYDAMLAEFTQKKTKRASAMLTTATSPSSMESILSNGPPSDD